MNSIIARQLDQHAYWITPAHRLDARAKTLAALFFCGTVISFPKYALAPLLPFALFPAALAIVGRVPLQPLVYALIRAAPFALVVGIFNPLLDRAPHIILPGIIVSGGWISFFSIMARFLLTVSAVLVLVATTPFPKLGLGLAQLGLPRIFVDQLLVLYRYLFLLMDEAQAMARASALRLHSRRAPNFRAATEMLVMLLLRSWNRAERIYRCMQVRGFNGFLPEACPERFGWKDVFFLAGTVLSCLLLRLYPPHEIIGKIWLNIIS